MPWILSPSLPPRWGSMGILEDIQHLGVHLAQLIPSFDTESVDECVYDPVKHII